ncbi:hypothetical protein ACTWP5_19805 [Streptomyces sp. 4N509B]|uniref:hypothetical protein n=1 Tax=Streptomyces sp. 4N509B TaxID=3457413 RepID=UPI003FD6500A
MDALMVAKAVFLVREAHASREDAVHALGGYFPWTAFDDRVQSVNEAWDLVHNGSTSGGIVPSEVADARYFASAHARHGF